MNKEEFDQKYKDIERLLSTDLEQANQILATLKQTIHDPNQIIRVKLLQAKSLLYDGKPHQSKEIFENILQHTQKLIDPDLNAVIQYEYAHALLYLGKHAEALKNVDQAILFYKNQRMQNQVANCNIIYGTIYFSEAKYDEALSYYKKGMEVTASKNNNTYLRALGNIANIYSVQGNLIQSAEILEEACTLASKLKNYRVYSILNMNLGITFLFLGNFKQSIKKLDLALKYAKILRNQLLMTLSLIAMTHYYMELGELPQVEKLLIDVRPILDELSHPHAHLEFYQVQIKFMLMKGNILKAYQIAKKSIKYLKFSGRDANSVELYVLIAEITYSLGKLAKSYGFISQAIEIAENSKSYVDKIRILITRGKINLFSNHYFEAELILNEALHLSLQFGCLELENKIRLLLVRVYLKKFQQAGISNQVEQIKTTIQTSLKRAQEHSLVSIEMQSLMLYAIFQFALEKYEESHSLLTQAYQIAHKKGITNDEKLISDLIQLVEINSKSFDQTKENFLTIPSTTDKFTNPIQRFAYTLLEDTIDKMTLSFPQKTFNQTDIDEIFLVGYKIDEIVGPAIHSCTLNQYIDTKWENILNHLSNIYYLAIGQGSAYQTGLFGPFPVINENKRALVFASFLNDKAMTDPRLENQNYYLLTMIFPSILASFFYDQQKVSHIFEDFCKNLSEISCISMNQLNVLKEKLIEEFIPNDEMRNNYN